MERPDLDVLCRARHLLENPGAAMKLADLAGKPVELGLKALPDGAREIVVSASKKAMDKALDAVLLTMDRRVAATPKDWIHRLAVGALGATGGFFGLATLPVELPLSTMVMLRSIAEHARSNGEDLATFESRLQCLSVFALGGSSKSDDDAEAGYFAVRAALAGAVGKAASYLAEKSVEEAVAEKSAPVVARLVARIATRFTPEIADKVAAQLVPVVGAVGGASINLVFMSHFQDMAWGHFSIRRLERQYGQQAVREAYEKSSVSK